MKKIEMADLLEYRFLSRPSCSPWRDQAVFLVNKQNAHLNRYQGNLYLADLATGAVSQLTRTGKASSFVWDSDGVLLCGKKAKEGADFERLSVADGTTSPAFHFPHPVLGITPVEPGKTYLVLADVNHNQKEGLSAAQKKDEEDYIPVSELPLWDNGVGYVSGHRDALFLLEEKTGEARPITQWPFTVGAYVLTPDKKQVAYSGCSYTQLKPRQKGLYLYDIPSQTTKTILPEGEYRIGKLQMVGEPLFFPASLCDKHGSSQKDDLFTCDLATLTVKKIAENDYTIGCNVSTDCRFGGGSPTGEYQGKLLYLTTEGSRVGMNLLDKAGNKEKLPEFAGAIENVSVKGEKILFVAMENGKLQELYLYDGKEYRQLTCLNEAALKNKAVSLPEYAGFTNSSGVKIDGWVIKPVDFDPNKTYPGVLSMHGGPCVAWGELFVHEMQVLAGMGYFVFLCNPRGSDGRGAEFADLRGHWGEYDFPDFMEFTDHVLALYPQMDPGRLGVIGGSYGGYMTNWIIGHTKRFAAAVSQRSFCNPISDFGVSCIGYTFDPEQFCATPWSDVELLWEHAPVKYAPDVVTPTLFIHALEDYNCPLTEGFQMFSALKYHGVESEMYLFKGENHELSRSGKPKHRQRRLFVLTDWLNRHLQ